MQGPNASPQLATSTVSNAAPGRLVVLRTAHHSPSIRLAAPTVANSILNILNKMQKAQPILTVRSSEDTMTAA